MLTKTKPFVITLCILMQLLAFFSCTIKKDSQLTELTEQQQQLIRELNQWLIPLGPFPLDLTDNELSCLDQLQDAKMVALGEATHGTREFFQMKHRIFQYLVEYLNHKAFGFEADFAESLYLNHYVTTGEGNLEELMRTRMHFWTWKTGEVKELLQWMKDYNTGKNEEEKIHYFGFDCQYTTYQPELLQEYFLRTVPALWDAAAPVMEQIQSLSTGVNNSISEETYNAITAQLESLENQVIVNRDQLIATSSPGEYEINKQLLKTVRQAIIVRYHFNNNVSPNWRDQFMAENALWIADFFGQDTKITLWAHNAHIARDPAYGHGGSMGNHLNQELNNLYQVIGFAFSQGSFTAVGVDASGSYTGLQTHQITTEPHNTSINFLFHHASHLNFAFHLDAIPGGSLWDNWLANSRPFISIGSVYNGNPGDYYRIVPLREHYDWIIYFDSTNAAVRL